jgi:stalled ribosome rescue protein Dom34
MTSHYHAVVWIDHHQARIFHFDREGIDALVIRPENPTLHIHHKANTIGSGHAGEDPLFLKCVTEAITDASVVLITGPANAKHELATYIAKHAPSVAKKIAGVETANHPSDKQLVAHARHYFKDDNQRLPRVQ